MIVKMKRFDLRLASGPVWTGLALALVCLAACTVEGQSDPDGDVVSSAISEDPEVSRGKPVTASSSEASELGPSNALDGNDETRWASVERRDPQWIRIDLGTRHAISRVRIKWERAFASAYRIEVSDDGAQWKAVFSTTSGNGGVDDLTVSGSGRYVRLVGTKRATSWGYSLWSLAVFGKPASSRPPAPTPTPTAPPPAPPDGGAGGPTGFPNASNVGLHVATTRTLAGANIDDASWFAANGFPGTGSSASPFVVDRVLFTGPVFVGSYEASSNLVGKHVKFTNSRFYGNPSNPTRGGSAFLSTRGTGLPARIIVEDSTLGEEGGVAASGGPAIGRGVDKGFLSFTSFELRRNDIYGACVGVYFETERNEATSIIEDNYIHDTWSSADDHTDLINGNMHASHIVVRHNTLDGIRTGGTYVVNGIGIYDDNTDWITDWTIDRNYIDRAQTQILATTSTSRFRDPFVVTNNVFTNRYTVGRFVARSPSVQSGNTDTNGVALRF